MWLDRVAVIKVEDPWPLAEPQLAELLAPSLAGMPTAPRMVIDGRPASVKVGSTATYRLLTALGLELAAPVAVSFAGVEAAYHALESLIQVCPNGGPALVVTATGSPSTPCLVGCCLVTAGPMTTTSVALSKPRLLDTATGSSGFIDLLTPAWSLSRPRL